MLKTDIYLSPEDFNRFLPVSIAFDIKKIEPYIRTAISDQILDVCPIPFYEGLYQNFKDDTLTEVEDKAFDLIKQTAALLAFKRYIPFLQVQISSTGIQIVSDEKKKTAFPWQVEEIKKECLEMGFQAMEDLSIYLFENAEELTLFKDSFQHTKLKTRLVAFARDFTNAVGYKANAHIFHLLKHKLFQEEARVKNILSTNFFAHLKVKMITQTLSTKEQELLVLIREAVSYAALSNSINELSLNFGPEGIFQKKPTKYDQYSREKLQKQHKESAEEKYTELTKFLNDHATEFPFFPVEKTAEQINFNGDQDGLFIAL